MARIPVQFVRLDDALGELGIDQVDYLSVTVNGAEVEVLKGASDTLRRSRPLSRVYAKGHARDEQGRPVHVAGARLVEALGFRTIITRGEPSSTEDADWRRRSGDLYAWKLSPRP